MGARQSHPVQTRSSSPNANPNTNGNGTYPREFYGLVQSMAQFVQPLAPSIVIQHNPGVTKRIVELQNDFVRLREEFERNMSNHIANNNAATISQKNGDNPIDAMDASRNEAYMRDTLMEMTEAFLRIAILTESVGGPNVDTLVSQMENMSQATNVFGSAMGTTPTK